MPLRGHVLLPRQPLSHGTDRCLKGRTAAELEKTTDPGNRDRGGASTDGLHATARARLDLVLLAGQGSLSPAISCIWRWEEQNKLIWGEKRSHTGMNGGLGLCTPPNSLPKGLSLSVLQLVTS